MFCPNCGKPVPDGAAVCPNCGTQLPNKNTGSAQDQQSAGSAPTTAYDSLGTSYQTPRTIVEAGNGKPGNNVGNAPKQKVPTVLIVVIAVVACLLLTMVFRESIPEPIRNVIPDVPGITQHTQTAQTTTNPAGTGEGESGLTTDSPDVTGNGQTGSGDTTNGGSSSSSSNSSSSDSNADKGVYADLVGTWTGTLQSDPECYGSQVNVPVLTIKSVDDSGKVHFDVKLNFHNHDSQKDGSTDGDEMLEFKDLTASIQNNSFSYKFDVTKYGEDAQFAMTVSFSGNKDARDMSMDVYSYLTNSYRDKYLMTK